MDKNDNRGSGYYGRRVNGFENEPGIKKGIQNNRHSKSNFEQKRRQTNKKNNKRLRMKRIRAAVILLLAVVLVIILIFMTPLFNIRQITVEGNNRVTLQEIDNQVHDLAGQNLFRVSSSNIRKRLKQIAYIDDAHASKHIYPPSIRISLRECIPAGYIMINGYKVVIDKDLKVLSDDKYKNDKIPEIRGLETERYVVGKTFEPSESEKSDILHICLTTMSGTGILEQVDYIDLSSLTGIKFRYDDRLDALCGTQLDLDRKIRLFKETVISNSIAENAKGIIDLSVTGKAVYTP